MMVYTVLILYNILRICAIWKTNINMEKTHIMERQSYYIDIGAGDINREVTDRFIAVNCSGFYVSQTPFTSENRIGRKDYYIQYLIEGELELPDMVMYPGDAIVYFPHTYYYYRSKTENIKYYWVHFSGSCAEEMVSECGLENSKIMKLGINERFSDNFERIFQDFITRGPLFEMSLSKNMVNLLYELALLNRFDQNDRTIEVRSDKLISQVVSEIHRSYNRELSISGLAQSVYMSEGYLRALFKEKYGISPKKYLISVRISAAKQLLSQTTMTVEQITQEIGMNDPLYFSQLFRQNTGVSPTEYRKRRSQK